MNPVLSIPYIRTMLPAIQKVRFKEGLPLEIEIISIADTVIKHEQTITNPHRADFYHVFWIQEGTATYLIDFQPVQLRKDSVLFVNKDRVQVVDRQSPHDGKLLLFTEQFFALHENATRFLHTSILFTDILDIPVIHLHSPSAISAAFQSIEKELNNDNDSYHYPVLHNLLYNLLLNGERERKKQGFTEIIKGANLDYTMLFKDLLEQHFSKTKSVSSYADQMNVSEKKLNTATLSTVGKSPKQIIDERVLLEAKRLLVHTSLSIKEIGYRIGFEEPTNFIKYFRKHIQKTPIEFRESFLLS